MQVGNCQYRVTDVNAVGRTLRTYVHHVPPYQTQAASPAIVEDPTPTPGSSGWLRKLIIVVIN